MALLYLDYIRTSIQFHTHIPIYIPIISIPYMSPVLLKFEYVRFFQDAIEMPKDIQLMFSKMLHT